jgi:tRNA-dihydrouridine synthase B
MMHIGPYQLKNSLFLAPMVGVSDTPFREICAENGAGLTIAEMLTSNSELWQNERNRLKRIKPKSRGPNVVQIAGSDPLLMAEAAALNAELGADSIDINMGCPAKKVLKKAAGSALLKDRNLVERILKTVVARIDIPVTLKIRTGWSPETRNGVEIAKIAEDCGVRLLKNAVSIPVIANGDIDSPSKAAAVLRQTGVDGLMIGRAAQGRPWIFREIEHFLVHGTYLPEITLRARSEIIFSHLIKLHSFYGDVKGVWYARKHVAAYVKELSESQIFMKHFNTIEAPAAQLDCIYEYFIRLDADGIELQGAEAA